MSWAWALVWIIGVAALLWIVEIVNLTQHYDFLRFGLVPRQVDGLWGVLTAPFLHASAAQMASDTLPVILIGWVVMLSGLRVWTIVTVSIILLGGLLTWLVGPADHVTVGASALVFGWMGYLVARALFSRRVKWIFTAVAVLFFFGTLFFSFFPTLHSYTSWQAHVCGLVAGFVVGFALHPRGGATRTFRRTAVS